MRKLYKFYYDEHHALNVIGDEQVFPPPQGDLIKFAVSAVISMGNVKLHE